MPQWDTLGVTADVYPALPRDATISTLLCRQDQDNRTVLTPAPDAPTRQVIADLEAMANEHLEHLFLITLSNRATGTPFLQPAVLEPNVDVPRDIALLRKIHASLLPDPGRARHRQRRRARHRRCGRA